MWLSERHPNAGDEQPEPITQYWCKQPKPVTQRCRQPKSQSHAGSCQSIGVAHDRS